MPMYEISPGHSRSYTSPFEDYGLGAEEAPLVAPPVTTTDVALTQTKETDVMEYLSPIIAGSIMAIFVYGVSVNYDVPKDKARQVAVIMGGVTALGHGLSNWLFNKTEPIRQSLVTAGPIPAGTGRRPDPRGHQVGSSDDVRYRKRWAREVRRLRRLGSGHGPAGH